jgi:signal transduction histidine kinase
MDLRPPMLDEIGLVPTLGWYFDRYTSRTRVQVAFRHDLGAMRFPDAIELTTFRIIQEALTNVARHAGVEAVDVEIRADPEGVWLLIEDKGKGFNPRKAPTGRSTGLIGMQERARLVGGHLTLETTPGAGTRIAVVLPIPGADPALEGGQELEP